MSETNTGTARIWPQLTIAILAFNRRDEVRITLQSLTNGLDYPAARIEIIVVDNASSDGTSEMLASDFPEVRCLTLSANSGVAGWNRAFEAASGRYFLVLDDDSAPVSGLGAALEFLEANPRVGILACNVVGGAFPTSGFDLKDGQSWVGFIGCGAIIRRSLYERIGGFAEWLFIYAHEWEYGLRCLDAGFEIRYFERCVIEHRAAAANRSSRRLIAHTVRNELLTVYKHFPERRAIFYVRVLAFNLRYYRPLGLRGIPYIAEGCWKFLRDAPQLERSFVKPETQARYASQILTAEPVLPRLFARVRRALLKEPRQGQRTDGAAPSNTPGTSPRG
jgi:hypothetical protein